MHVLGGMKYLIGAKSIAVFGGRRTSDILFNDTVIIDTTTFSTTVVSIILVSAVVLSQFTFLLIWSVKPLFCLKTRAHFWHV